MTNHMLSTSDNPYNPFTQWDDWWSWDYPRYNTLSLLARVTRTSEELSEQLQDDAIEDAMLEIVTENVSGVHIRVDEPKATAVAEDS